MVRRGRTRSRTIYRNIKSKARRPKRNDLKRYAKKALMGTVGGLAVAIPVSLLAKHLNMPELVEVADRGGAVAASVLGGSVGVVGYQIADALFDRFVVFNDSNISGGSQVYL